MPPGRPPTWDTGEAPPDLGSPPEKFDKDGLFAPERKQREEWESYLKGHKPGTTERKWDNALRKRVEALVQAMLKKTRLRTEAAEKIHAIDVDSMHKKRIIKDNKDNVKRYNSNHEGDAQGTARMPEQPTLEEIGAYLCSFPGASRVNVNDTCDILKSYMRAFMMAEEERERVAERTPLVNDFKNLSHDVILAKDDINYLLAKMRECAYQYQRIGEDADDDEYELPAVDLIFESVPSMNKTSRRNEMAQIAALAGAATSATSATSAGDDLEAQMAAAEEESAGLASSSDDDDEDEQPAKKRPRSDSCSSAASSAVSGSRVASDPSLE